jgi:hypothetical protein
MFQCKSILHVLIFVRAQLVLSLSPPSGCSLWVKTCKLGHHSYPSRLKDSNFSSVHPINCYMNLSKQQNLVFEDQFSLLALPILLGVRGFLQLLCKLH